jgi:hypothetical protein
MGWYEAIKDALGAADRLRDADLKSKLADVQIECAKLAEENARLRSELLEFKEQARIRQDMAYEDNVYWQSGSASPSGPFCPKCLDGSGKIARMTIDSDDHCWRCHVCGHSVIKPSGRRQSVVDDFDD